jgi:chromosomal replication initiation ATPase DnaA
MNDKIANNKSLAKIMAEMILDKYIPEQFRHLISIETIILEISELIHNYNKTHKLSIENIRLVILSHEKIDFETYNKNINNRKTEWVRLRQIMMWCSKKYTRETYDIIARKIYRGDHSNCLHAINHVNDLIDTEPSFRERIFLIEQEIIKHSFLC